MKYNNEVSGRWKARKGVRQGGAMSAHLFVAYTDSISTEISELPYGCRFGINKVNIQAYSDDFVVYCSTPIGLRTLIEALHGLLTAHGLQINSSKSKVLVFFQGYT